MAGHPWEVHLFFGDYRPGEDIDERIGDVHRRAGEYAHLDYYLGKIDNQSRRLFEVLAILEESETQKGWIGCYRIATEDEGADANALAECISELEHRGFVEVIEDRYSVLPVLRHYLLKQADNHPSEDEQKHWHANLGSNFAALALTLDGEEDQRDGRSEQPPKDQDGLDPAAVRRLQVNLFRRSVYHLTAQDDLLETADALQKFASRSLGYISVAVVIAFARRFAEKVERTAERSPPANNTNTIGLYFGAVAQAFQVCRDWNAALQYYQKAADWLENYGPNDQADVAYHQIGIVFQHQRRWEEALENYRKAIDWNQNSGQLHQVGNTHHQIGIVFQHQRQWEDALENYRQAIDWFQRTDAHHELVGTLTMSGRTYVEAGKWTDATKALISAIAALEKHGAAHPSELIGLVKFAYELAPRSELSAETGKKVREFLDAVFQEHPELKNALENENAET